MDILSKGGGKTLPTYLGFFDGEIWDSCSDAEDNFSLISISVVVDVCRFQYLGTIHSKMWMRMEWGFWMDEWLGGRWDVNLYFSLF